MVTPCVLEFRGKLKLALGPDATRRKAMKNDFYVLCRCGNTSCVEGMSEHKQRSNVTGMAGKAKTNSGLS